MKNNYEKRVAYLINNTWFCGGWIHSMPLSVINAFSSIFIGTFFPFHSSTGVKTMNSTEIILFG